MKEEKHDQNVENEAQDENMDPNIKKQEKQKSPKK